MDQKLSYQELQDKAEYLESELNKQLLENHKLKESVDNLIYYHQKFKETLDLLPEIIYEIDLTGKFTYVNKIALDLTDFTYEELKKGIYITDLLSETDKQKALENFDKIKNGIPVKGEEYHVISPKGRSFHVITHTRPIMENNNVVGFRGLIIDNTIKKQESLELQQNMENLQFLIESSFKLINIPDQAEFYNYMAEEFRRLSGAMLIAVSTADIQSGTAIFHTIVGLNKLIERFSQVLGQSLNTTIFNIDPTIILQLEIGEMVQIAGGINELTFEKIPLPVCKVIETMFNVGNIYVIGLVNKSEVFGYISFIMPKYTDIQNIKFLETVTRQTALIIKQKENEDAIHESEKRYRAVFDNAQDCIFLIDFKGMIFDVNNRACRILGYSKPELSTLNIADLIPSYKTGSMTKMIETLKISKNYYFVEKAVKNDKTVIDLDISASIIDFGHEPTILAIAREKRNYQ